MEVFLMRCCVHWHFWRLKAKWNLYANQNKWDITLFSLAWSFTFIPQVLVYIHAILWHSQITSHNYMLLWNESKFDIRYVITIPVHTAWSWCTLPGILVHLYPMSGFAIQQILFDVMNKVKLMRSISQSSAQRNCMLTWWSMPMNIPPLPTCCLV